MRLRKNNSGLNIQSPVEKMPVNYIKKVIKRNSDGFITNELEHHQLDNNRYDNYQTTERSWKHDKYDGPS